jgi:LysM repeat protein
MRLKHYVWLLAGVALLLSLAPILALASPTAQDQNLLTNPGFEGGWHWQGDSFLGKVADGWTAWWVDEASGKADNDPSFWKNQRPEYGLAGMEYHVPEQVHSGSRALQYGKRYATHTAGVYQQISGITPGSKLRFSAWGFVYGKDPDPSRNPGYVHMKVGIDPTGGTNVFGGSVVWSGVVNPVAVGSGSAWQQMSVETVAQKSTVTVFVYSSPDWPMGDALTSQWDDTSLVVIAPAETPTNTPPPPPPTSTPGPPPPPPATATPRPDGSVVHTVQSGETLWAIAIQYASGSSITPEQMLEQVKELNGDPALIYAGQELTIAVPQNPLPTPAAAPEEGSESASPPAEESEQAVAVAAAESEQPAAVAAAESEQPAAPAEAPDAVAAPATSGAICVSAYHDRNSDGARDPSTEELLPNAGFTLSSESGVVASYTSDGENEPYCFAQLVPGTYMIQLSKPDGYNATTHDSWAVPLLEGTTIKVEFGNQRDPNAPAMGDQSQGGDSSPLTSLLQSAADDSEESQSESKSESKSLLSRLGEIAIGVSGIFVLLLAGAVGMAFVASRRRI